MYKRVNEIIAFLHIYTENHSLKWTKEDETPKIIVLILHGLGVVKSTFSKALGVW